MVCGNFDVKTQLPDKISEPFFAFSVRPKVHDVMGPNGGSSDSMSKLTNIDDVLNSLVKWLCFQVRTLTCVFLI